MIKNIILFSLTILYADGFEYSLEDVNSNSSTFGENVWFPEYSNY